MSALISSVNPGLASTPSASVRRPASPEQAARDFESLFLGQMMQIMLSENMPEDTLSGDPESDEIYRGWMADEYGKMITQRGGIGIADHVKRQLLMLQEV